MTRPLMTGGGPRLQSFDNLFVCLADIVGFLVPNNSFLNTPVEIAGIFHKWMVIWHRSFVLLKNKITGVS